MSITLQNRHSSTAGNAPTSLADGEIGINHPDRKLYVKDGNNNINSVDLTSDAEKVASGPISTALGNKANASQLATPSFQRFSVADGNATSGQASFTVAAYTIGTVLVFLNGAKLPGTQFTASSGNTVVLSDALQASDILEVLSWLMAGVQNAAPLSHQHQTGDILGLSAFIGATLAALPTSLPAQSNKLWNNNGVVSIS